MKTITTIILGIILLNSCKKKDKDKSNYIPTTDTTISFKISLFNSRNGASQSWHNPKAFVVAPGYQSNWISLAVTTLTNTVNEPCNDYHISAAENYDLVFRKNTVDTIILLDTLPNTAKVLRTTFIYDLTQNPATLTRFPIGTNNGGVICPRQGPNTISYGNY